MPLYTYVCKDCGTKFDLLIGVTSEKTKLECSKCGSKNIEKTFGVAAVRSSGGKSGSSDTTPSAGTCPTGVCPTCF
ncbi:MAG: hypothetical protein B6D56_05000 [Candidatus Omnitrophica bacterium 4484_70.1]|nr:MAG: hypothetical protein B6D56_05000 [Candidatus Omnitrophica bacterium 4484_70.1]